MTATQTSIEAFRSLRDSGELGEHQAEALEVLRKWGPGTAKEMARASGADFANLQKRLSELVDRHGLAVRLEFRACDVTGRRATVWAAKDSRAIATSPACDDFSGRLGPSGGKHGASSLELHAKDPQRGTIYRGEARPVGRCGCGSVAYFCKEDGCGQCNAPGHQMCAHEKKRRLQ